MASINKGTISNFAQRDINIERPETPPNPSAIIPIGRDPDFIEPGTILEQIDQKCAAPGSRTALVGLGGVGKSQIAIEYAHRRRERSPSTWVFWVHASNAARFETSYRDIADFVKIPGRKNPKANIFQLVYDWLRDERRSWVLILDNVDHAGFLSEPCSDRDRSAGGERGSNGDGSQPLKAYLPQCQNGAVLVTTRSRSAALELVERRDMIAVEPMSEADAVALLEKKLEGIEKSDRVGELAAALEFMPLAMVQATSYIVHRAPRCSVRQYLEKFQEGDRKRTSLLNFEKGQLRRDRDAKNSIIVTWQISFDHIRHVRPSAADLLSLMSFFDRQGIPEALLRSRNGQSNVPEKHGGDAEDVDSNVDEDKDEGEDDDQSDNSMDCEGCEDEDDEFEDDVSTLRDYSFITVTTRGSGFEMHRLVQLATWKWLEAHGQREKWKHQFIKNLCSALPTGGYENWTACQALFPHAKSAAAQKPKGQESLEMWATILYRAGWYAEQIGNGAEAEEMSVAALKTRKKLLGQEHEDTLWSISLVGNVYNLRGRWEEAESLFVQVMEMSKSKLGADHPSTLTSMANLASTYRNQGRWEEAESLEVQVMEIRKSKLGADHPSTLTSMANLASTYRNQGRWEEAESLEVQVMEIRKSKLGADHPDTLTSMANLASTYRNQGRWEEAESLEVQVMEIRKSKLGADHPSTLTSMANLASTYWNQGRWEEAESLFVQVIEMSKSKLGADHPDTLTSMNNLAFTFKGRGEGEKALMLIEECVEKRKQSLGPNHPYTKDSEETLNSWRIEALSLSSDNKSYIAA
ncbi:hypothetical protein BDV95DRAFT_605272 [Massariosphaeria phaeospora]|uniref:DUF7779 domain-containing protein n=1 Tax=Massariosphaeria phaeospora TaxID=100035 RepID=A0A7C8MDA3_9PLEO|nr:hypothetical protein BDV95DRAFT_605272 [Massariosphaeria phaeospora]